MTILERLKEAMAWEKGLAADGVTVSFESLAALIAAAEALRPFASAADKADALVAETERLPAGTDCAECAGEEETVSLTRSEADALWKRLRAAEAERATPEPKPLSAEEELLAWRAGDPLPPLKIAEWCEATARGEVADGVSEDGRALWAEMAKLFRELDAARSEANAAIRALLPAVTEREMLAAAGLSFYLGEEGERLEAQWVEDIRRRQPKTDKET